MAASPLGTGHPPPRGRRRTRLSHGILVVGHLLAPVLLWALHHLPARADGAGDRSSSSVRSRCRSGFLPRFKGRCRPEWRKRMHGFARGLKVLRIPRRRDADPRCAIPRVSLRSSWQAALKGGRSSCPEVRLSGWLRFGIRDDAALPAEGRAGCHLPRNVSAEAGGPPERFARPLRFREPLERKPD